MNTESIKANKVASLGEVKRPGDFAFSSDRKTMFMMLPGETIADGIRIVSGPQEAQLVESPRWVWDGNEESPTLNPSIHAPGVWHGYLTNGQFKSC